ncbi:porin family protein [Pasteurellaceae bacterium 20609_3]|uniref:outer membrane protein n=1 Tax=Spirabiliibacterium mucosae TaxID=28156 RepID=UPI001AAC5CC8|nr:outer membrane protein [Spirabiliibacterium mucosae]MBE2899110.1 porin family protein [Spirabiliibacterium mucosae]
MLKKSILCVALAGALASGAVLADTRTVSLDWAHANVKNASDLNGFAIGYQHEWDNTQWGVLGTFSYMKGTTDQTLTIDPPDKHQVSGNVKYYSLLAGPTYRFNPVFSAYAQLGLAHVKADVDWTWLNHESGNYIARGHGSESKDTTALAYAVGVKFDVAKNFSVNVGYEGTNASIDDPRNFKGYDNFNGWRLGVGYSF